MTHFIITHNSIESYERVAEVAKACGELVMLGNALVAPMEVVTVSNKEKEPMLLNMVAELNKMTVYVKANRNTLDRTWLAKPRKMHQELILAIKEA